jgi:hypothetical protein
MYTIIATLFTYILIFISFFRCVAVPQTALPWCSNQRLCIPLDPGRVASCTGWWTCNYLPPTPDHVPLHQAADGAPISTSWSHYSNLQCTDDPSQHTRTATTSPVHGETVDQQPTPSSAVMVRVPAADPYK